MEDLIMAALGGEDDRVGQLIAAGADVNHADGNGWIMQEMTGYYGLSGWQWMFVIEAIPSFVLAFVVLAFLDNGIAPASWLTAEEKAILTRNIEADRGDAPLHSMWDGCKSPVVWRLSGIYLFFIMGLYGVSF